MRVDDNIIHHVETLGWECTSVKGGWKLVRPDLPHPLYLSATDSWLSCQMRVDTTGSDGTSDTLSRVRHARQILAQNEQMFQARFAQDREGNLLLSADIPRNTTQSVLLNRALEVLSTYATQLPSVGKEQMEAFAVATALPEAKRLPDYLPGIPIPIMARYVKGVELFQWGARSEPTGLTWHLGYKGRFRKFDAYLTVTRMWSYFHIPLLAESEASVLYAEPKTQLAFAEYLLRLNDAWFMAKLGINEAKQVLLLLEVPTEALDFPLFRLIVQTLSAYLDRYGREIQLMATLERDTHLFELLNNANKKPSGG